MTIVQPSTPPAPAAPAAPSTGAPAFDPAAAQQAAQHIAQQALQQTEAALQQAQVARARAAQATAQGASGAPGQQAPIAVIRDNNGRVVVTGRDGRTIILDPKAGLDQDAIQEAVQTALKPPSLPVPPDAGPSRHVVEIVFIVFASLLLMVLAISRAIGGRRAAAAAALPPETAARIARIEQAVEAVAIEVERISEAQRYSARLLTERLPEPVPGRAVTADALPAPVGGRGA